MKIFIYPNLLKPNSGKYTEQAYRVLSERGCELFMQDENRDEFGHLEGIRFMPMEECVKSCDVIIVIGGDGTILRCSAAACRHNKPMLGINCGTLGFMASLEFEDIDKLGSICEGEYTVTDRMMLSVTVKKGDGNIVTADALNDVVLHKGEDIKLVDFEVVKAGRVVSSLRADGVIFSTATGATAYSLSAGGPLIEPDMQCIEFSQICAHSLFARPMIFSPDSALYVRCICGEGSHVTLTVDGTRIAKLSESDTIEIKRSELVTRIIDIKGGSFFSTVHRKLMTPIK